MEAATDFPFSYDLVAAPAGRSLAWAFQRGGVRAVKAARPDAAGRLRTHTLASFAGDDGLQLGQIAWSDDGATVVFVRGADIDGDTPNANPLDLSQRPPAAEIWTVDGAGGPPHRLVAGAQPTPSPRTRQLAYIEQGAAWLTSLDHAQAPRRVSSSGDVSDLRWSPDGATLAWVARRAGGSVIEVLNTAAGTVTAMTTVAGVDRAPEWSPDGRRIAWVRSDAQGARDFLAGREGQPWAIWVADLATGSARPVFTADAGAGSVFRALEDQSRALRWMADGRIVFPWEKTGWLNLYEVDAATGSTRPRVSGAFEVFSTDVGADRRSLVYLSNAHDLDGRCVGRDGRDVVDRAGDLYAAPQLMSDGDIALLKGDSDAPLSPAVVEHGVPALLEPVRGPAFASPAPRTIVFPAADGLELHGQLFAAPANLNGRRPAVVFFHGGPQRQMLPGWSSIHAYAEWYAFNRLLASRGYIVLSVNYRGGTGYGLNFREATGQGPLGATEAADAVGAAQDLAHRSDVDPRRIAAMGGSYGGLMTGLALARGGGLYAAGVDYAGIHDWKGWLGDRLPAAYAGIAAKSSVDADLSGWTAPVLVAFASDDQNVPAAESTVLIEGLRRRAQAPQVLVIAHEQHDFMLARSWTKLFVTALQFLDHSLEQTRAAPFNAGR